MGGVTVATETASADSTTPSEVLRLLATSSVVGPASEGVLLVPPSAGVVVTSAVIDTVAAPRSTLLGLTPTLESASSITDELMGGDSVGAEPSPVDEYKSYESSNELVGPAGGGGGGKSM